MSEKEILIIQGKLCPYCNCETNLVGGAVVYPHRINDDPLPKFMKSKYYMCLENSNHYVGTYQCNVRSLGRVADSELRKLKQKGHKTFDPLWKNKQHFKNQKEAYFWLSEKMNLPFKYTHFGMFSNEQCLQAIEACEELASNY